MTATATATNIHLPPALSQPSPQPSASALSYRSGTRARASPIPHRHVSFSFDGGPPTSPHSLASSLALSPPIPLVAPDPPRVPQASPLETLTPATSAGRRSKPGPLTREGSRSRPRDDFSNSNPFIDVINDTPNWNMHGDEEEDSEEEDELDNNSHTPNDNMLQDHHHPNRLPPLPSSNSSSRRSRTPTTSPHEAPPQPTGPPHVSAAFEEIALCTPTRPTPTSRSVIRYRQTSFTPS